MNEEEIKIRQFYEILKYQKIYPVYQPIVSLKDGSVYGYEALSRIKVTNNGFGTEKLFQIAEREKKLWQLEEMCRSLSLKRAFGKKEGQKLFLNVDANIINDTAFVRGFTRKKLDKYGLVPGDIMFEITERTAIDDKETFKETVAHYKNQGYGIAIDDVGEGYSGLNRICSVAPDFLKIDMQIIRDIHKNTMKCSLVKCILEFCKELKISLIAEGIETKEELEKIIELGVCYGQGFFLGRPKEKIEIISVDVVDMIIELYKKHQVMKYQPSFFGTVETLCSMGITTKKDTKAVDIFETFRKESDLSEICVIDDEQVPIGILTRKELNEAFGGRFGFSLNSKRTVKEIMRKDFLVLDGNTSIESVSKVALSRVQEQIYDAVVVIKDDKYIGTVTIKNLLEAAVTIQVSRAVDANPLTGLPGNLLIQNKIKEVIEDKKPFAIIYLDLDNFKAYNDAYGFNNGDLMIQLVADIMKESISDSNFKGHIGGDDFVVVAGIWDVKDMCERMITEFQRRVRILYNEKDWENGYIISKNRNGFIEQFPIASLSISVATNENKQYKDVFEFSNEIAKVKKRSKKIEGNSICIGLEEENKCALK
ncbi:MAG: EAL and GGDEF domain-containing protein [Anaerostipes sp.]|nr:EAL and GGDEF domain-containing protein [Anaerostipes sp.]